MDRAIHLEELRGSSAHSIHDRVDWVSLSYVIISLFLSNGAASNVEINPNESGGYLDRWQTLSQIQSYSTLILEYTHGNVALAYQRLAPKSTTQVLFWSCKMWRKCRWHCTSEELWPQPEFVIAAIWQSIGVVVEGCSVRQLLKARGSFWVCQEPMWIPGCHVWTRNRHVDGHCFGGLMA